MEQVKTSDVQTSVYRFKTGTTYTIGKYSVEEEGEYPQDWFTNNPGHKPSIQFSFSSIDYGMALAAVTNLETRQIPSGLIMMILHKFGEKTKIILNEDWTCDGIQIGKKDEEISISSLYTPILGTKTWEGFQGNSTYPEEVIIGSLLLIYRIIRVPQSPMLSEVIDSIATRFKAVHSVTPVYSVMTARDCFMILDNDINFRKLIASYDMFFTKFPKHQLAKLRIGTLPSRWRDFTAFKNIFETYRLLGLTNAVEYAAWVWEPAIHQDLDRLLKKPFGIQGKEHGYFFYSSDFGIISKSIYSVTQNPAIHVFNQVIYCAFGNLRGLNARMVHPPNAPLVVKNALYVAFSLKTGTEWEVAFGSLEQKRHVEALGLNEPLSNQIVEEFQETVPMPEGRDPIAWFSYWKAIDGNYPIEYINFLKTVRVLCKDSRPNSVGQYLYNQLAVYY